jgi:hypothetical protein
MSNHLIKKDENSNTQIKKECSGLRFIRLNVKFNPYLLLKHLDQNGLNRVDCIYIFLFFLLARKPY